MQKLSDSTATIAFKRSCEKCSHLKVCTIVRAIAPLIANWEEGQRPFEATDLAAVCLEYLDSIAEANL
jgi:hypothetical protein